MKVFKRDMKRIVPYTYVRRGDPGTGAFHLRYEMGEVRPPPPGESRTD